MASCIDCSRGHPHEWAKQFSCASLHAELADVIAIIQNQGMMKGDPSLKAVKHPKFGKILVATRNLPKGYYVAWWGKLCPKKQVPYKRMEWALETSKGMVDAVPYKGSQLKYCACPGRIRITAITAYSFNFSPVTGPSELPTIDFAPNSVAASDKFLTMIQRRRDLIDF